MTWPAKMQVGWTLVHANIFYAGTKVPTQRPAVVPGAFLPQRTGFPFRPGDDHRSAPALAIGPHCVEQHQLGRLVRAGGMHDLREVADVGVQCRKLLRAGLDADDSRLRALLMPPPRKRSDRGPDVDHDFVRAGLVAEKPRAVGVFVEDVVDD